MKRPSYADEFKREAVRLLEVSGRGVNELAEDLGIARSTLQRWVREFKDQDLLAGLHEDASKELARLRKELELLRRERELLKRHLRSSPGRQVFEISFHRRGECFLSYHLPLRLHARQLQRILCLEEASCK